MYDAFSENYDRFMNWPSRLAGEMPFILRELRIVNAVRILDAACGTGMHMVALAKEGYEVTGADLSPNMIERTEANALAAGTQVKFLVAGFGQLAQAFQETFDAVLCLGNSLPHLLTPAELSAATLDFAACLRPGGLVLIQNRNYDAVISQHERWMEPQTHTEGNHEWLFLRFYDFRPDGLLNFNIVTLYRQGNNPWMQRVAATRLNPLRQVELTAALAEAGFGSIKKYGNLAGEAFDTESSGNLVVIATKSG